MIYGAKTCLCWMVMGMDGSGGKEWVFVGLWGWMIDNAV